MLILLILLLLILHRFSLKAMRYSFYFICWENPIRDKKPPPQPVIHSLLSTPQPISIKKGIYRRLLLLFSKPLTWLAYLLPFLSLPLLAGALPHNKTAVRPIAIGTILQAICHGTDLTHTITHYSILFPTVGWPTTSA